MVHSILSLPLSLPLQGQGILVELAIHLELGQGQLPVARLIQIEAAGDLARQCSLDLRAPAPPG